MTYGNPAKSLEIARSRLTPEQWQRFERDFDDFCVVNGMPRMPGWSIFLWAKWAALWMSERHLINSAAASNDRQRDAKYTRLALAMMDDEQREQSLERWIRSGE